MPHATPKTVSTTLNYHLAVEKGGHDSFQVGTVSDKRRQHVPVETQITDMRGMEDEFSVDKQGFQVVPSKAILSVEDYSDDDKVTELYHRDCERLIKEW
jgi:hypothetical protein